MTLPAMDATLERARALFLLGTEALEAERFVQAEAFLREAHVLLPERASIAINLAGALAGQKKYSDAMPVCRLAVGLAPDNFRGWLNLANSELGLDQAEAALKSIERALQLQPDDSSAQACQAAILAHLQHYEDALRIFRAVLKKAPDEAVHWVEMGNVLAAMKRDAQAMQAYEQALSIRPGFAQAHLNRALLLRTRWLSDEAAQACEAALACDPHFDEAWRCLAEIHAECGRYQAAYEALDTVARRSPESLDLTGRRLFYRLHACQWDLFDELHGRLMAGLAEGRPLADGACLLPVPSNAAQQQAACRALVESMASIPVSPRVERLPGRHARLRIGYFSADYFEHATAYLMAGLFDLHDRSHFELFAFSFGPNTGDAMRKRLENSFDHFHDVTELSEREIAVLARECEIDIAVDLKGHTAHARPGIFRYRPAPIQVSYLGYPGGMAMDCFDYLIADRVVIPPEHLSFYNEKVVWMPDSYQVNDAGRRIASELPSRAACGLPEGGLVFCCFNNAFKITPDVFVIWMGLLRDVPDSVLWLMGGSEESRDRLRATAQTQGVDGRRLVFASKLPLAQHLSRHAHADLFLDTFYYNAHTTCSDALWCGVPVVTCAGEAFPARVGASLLTAAGLPELIAESPSAYSELARSLALDKTRRQALREHLLRRPQTSPLFDTGRFARHLESAYTLMHERFVAGHAPEHLSIPLLA